jgi:hypothetical protein
VSDRPDDPFRAEDPRAAEREARRRAREERRRKKGVGARKSLADRVSGAIGGGAAEPQQPQEPQASPPPEPQQPPPAAAPQQPPEADSTQVQPQQPQQPAEPAAPRSEDDWLSDLDRKVETGEWLTDDSPSVTPSPQGAEPAPATPPPAAPAPAEPETGTHTDDWEAYGSVPQTRAAAEERGASGGGTPIATPPSDGRQKWTRRLIALGVLLVAIGALVLVARAIKGSDDPAPVAAGPKKLKTFDVVIPEGLTIAQMADVAKDAKIKGDYEDAVDKAAKKFNFKEYDADTDSLEGFLFPATYELEEGANADDLVAKQLEAFNQNFGSVDMKGAEKKNLTPYDVLIIASLIEEEVQVEKERALVAAVIYNRLSAGDTLGIDATLRYELEKYDGQLLESELNADTPYNTRINGGLPPTPIANPGLASMEAAANPADSDAYYFVVKPGTCGEHFFTEDSAEFDQAAAEYQAALQAEGGSPTEC